MNTETKLQTVLCDCERPVDHCTFAENCQVVKLQPAMIFSDYEEIIADNLRLVRELDVLINGKEGAAKQASLCDIVAQIKREGLIKRTPNVAELIGVLQIYADMGYHTAQEVLAKHGVSK